MLNYTPRIKRREWPALDAQDPFSELAKRALMLLYERAEVSRDVNGDRTYERFDLEEIRVEMHWMPHYQDGPVVEILRRVGRDTYRLLSFNLKNIIDYDRVDPTRVVKALEKFQRYMILEDLANA